MSVQITKSSRELTAVEKYAMTVSPAIIVVKSVDNGTVIPVVASCEFVDTKENGDEVHLISILDDKGQGYSSQSETFKKSFHDIIDLVGADKPFSIIKTGGTTRTNREFVNCALDVTSVK